MNRTPAITVALLLALILPLRLQAQEATPHPAPDAAPAAAAAEPYTNIPGTRISLHIPMGFTLATEFPGILREDLNAFVLASELPAPVQDVLNGMTKETWDAEGIELLRTQEVQVAGQTGTLFHTAEGEEGNKVRKRILVFGNDQATAMLAAGVPESSAEDVGMILEQAILNARWDLNKKLDPYRDMGFSLRESDIFEVRGRRSGGVLLARKEAPGEMSPDEPILVVYQDTRPAVLPLPAMAKESLSAGGQFVDFANFSERALTVHGLSGYEIVADAKEASHSIPVRILLVLLRAPDHDVIIEGVASPQSWDKYVSEFHGLAESFQEESRGKEESRGQPLPPSAPSGHMGHGM